MEQEGKESYRVPPLGEHRYLREDTTGVLLTTTFRGIRRGHGEEVGALPVTEMNPSARLMVIIIIIIIMTSCS